MSEQEINSTIAELCGWKYNGLGPIGTLHHPTKCHCFDGIACVIPNYSGDLNTMHEAEATLTGSQKVWYMRILCSFAHNHNIDNILTIDEAHHICHATAHQRCEAFLRTHNKWKD